jgi:hypothetical protein
MTGKYDPLRDHLRASKSLSLAMDFSEIERVIGASLPPSARTHVAWWGNDATSAATHTQCRAWRIVGFVARPDLAARTVTFARTRRA